MKEKCRRVCALLLALLLLAGCAAPGAADAPQKENGKTGDQSQKRSYRADRVAIGSPIPPGKYDQYNESNCGNDKGWEAP